MNPFVVLIVLDLDRKECSLDITNAGTVAAALNGLPEGEMKLMFALSWVGVGICLVCGAWHMALAIIGGQIIVYVLRGLLTDYWP